MSRSARVPGVAGWAGMCIGVLVVFAGLPRTMAAEPEPWEAALKMQLQAEQKCELLRIVSMRQLPVPGLDALEGRVRCTDGREFDFARPKPHQKFEIHLCAPAVC